MTSPFFGGHSMTVLNVKRLAGVCNGCGRCCVGRWEGRPFRCANLEVTGNIGTPNATRCRVYSQRWNGMPVMLRDTETGTALVIGQCWKDSDAETAAIISTGIGRGCSLVLVDKETT